MPRQTITNAPEFRLAPPAPPIDAPCATALDGMFIPRIPRYQIVRLIGAGGMGTVWEAQQDQPNRRVALKVLHPAMLNDALRRRFEYEARVLARLQHPGIAQIYDAGLVETSIGAQPYLAMELIDGQRLDNWVEFAAPPLKRKLDLLVRLCEAIQHAHQRGIIHRDLKPANIIVTANGQPKVLDFGIACSLDRDDWTQQTEIGQVVGSLSYMSPEQAAGRVDEVDTRSDVYALGVIAFELLAGVAPYELGGLSFEAAVAKLRDESPPRLGDVVAECRGDPETIVAKAMAREKVLRYGAAAELAADIERFMRFEPITARPPSRAYRLNRFVRRHRSMVTVVMIAIVALFAATVMSFCQTVRAVRAERAAVDEKAIAQQRFNDVRDLSNRMLFDVHAKIRNLPGSTEAAKLVVESGLAHLNKLAAAAKDDPQLLRDLGTSYAKLGDIQGAPGSMSNLGDSAGALASYRRALELHSAAAYVMPDDWACQSLLLLDLDRIGQIHHNAGDTSAAVTTFAEALERLHQLEKRGVGGWERRRVRASMLRKLAFARLSLGQAAQAIEGFREAIAIERELCDQLPQMPELRRSLAESLMRLGAVLIDRGEANGRPELDEALRIRQELVAANPRDVRYRHDLIGVRRLAAKVAILEGDVGCAAELITRAMNDLDDLQKADPANVALQNERIKCEAVQMAVACRRDELAGKPSGNMPAASISSVGR